jgi:hypothetical protein
MFGGIEFDDKSESFAAFKPNVTDFEIHSSERRALIIADAKLFFN